MHKGLQLFLRHLRGIHSIATGGSNSAFRAVEAQSPLPLRTGRDRLVILGTGWAGARLVKDIGKKNGANFFSSIGGGGWFKKNQIKSNSL